MRRRLFNLATIISLIVFLATFALWLRSTAYEDSFVRQSTNSDTIDFYSQQNPPVYATVGRLVSAGSSVYVGYENETVTYPGDSPFTGVNRFGHTSSYAPVPVSPTPERGVYQDVHGLAGFRYRRINVSDLRGTIIGFWLVIPYWMIAAPMLVFPAIWLWRRRVAKLRKGRNRCHTCNYDLRATPDRCPECGTPAVVNGARA